MAKNSHNLSPNRDFWANVQFGKGPTSNPVYINKQNDSTSVYDLQNILCIILNLPYNGLFLFTFPCMLCELWTKQGGNKRTRGNSLGSCLWTMWDMPCLYLRTNHRWLVLVMEQLWNWQIKHTRTHVLSRCSRQPHSKLHLQPWWP